METQQKLINQKQSRFSDAPWFQSDIPASVVVGGAGGIGSWLSLALGRAGFKIWLFDNDLIEEHNMAGQFFSESQITQHKTSAVAKNVKNFTGRDCVISKPILFDENSTVSRYMFSGFDNMSARRIMFERWSKLYGTDTNAIFIDGRLNAEQLQVFCVCGGDTENIQKYLDNHLPSDDKVEEPNCTLKQTTHVAMGIAFFMTSFFTNFIANLQEGNKARKVPFFYEYIAPLGMAFKTI